MADAVGSSDGAPVAKRDATTTTSTDANSDGGKPASGQFRGKLRKLGAGASASRTTTSTDANSDGGKPASGPAGGKLGKLGAVKSAIDRAVSKRTGGPKGGK